jgi:hypothetical protein
MDFAVHEASAVAYKKATLEKLGNTPKKDREIIPRCRMKSRAPSSM